MLRTTPTFIRPDVDPDVWEHGRRNMALVDAGLLSSVLPVTDTSGLAGFGIFTPPGRGRHRRYGGGPYDTHPVRGFPGSMLV